MALRGHPRRGPRPPPPVRRLERLPPAACYYARAADHRAPEESCELVERLRPELVGTIPIDLTGRQACFSYAKAHAAVGYQPRYSWTDWR